MTSFGYRLNPRYAIKECLSCGALYTGDFCCSKGNVEDKILVPKLPKNYARCARCGHPVDGLYCQGCTLLRKKLEEDLDHGVNPPHIDECCCECGDALDGIFCQQCTCKSCGKEEQAANARYWKIPACCDDDDDYNSAITPVLSTEKPDNSLSMGDEHLDTISATKSDEIIKSSVEDLVPIPSESEGIPDTMCDVHLVNNHTPLEAKDHFEIVINSNDDISPSDDDSLYNENIEYVEASPYNSELVSLEETNTFDNSLPEFENFCFDLEEISSGSTTTHSDISLSKYDSFTFDLSNDQFPATDRSDFTHEEFADELAHIISLPDLLYLAGSQPMLKSSYKAEDDVIISIPLLVGGVADVVAEIKGTGWSISITFRFSVRLQTPDDLSRSRLGFIEKMGVKGKQEKDKIKTKPDKTGSVEKPGSVEGQSQSRKKKKRRNTSSRDQICKSYKLYSIKDKDKGWICNLLKDALQGVKLPKYQRCKAKGLVVQ
nr:hypothetical protein [Tanacetum cinerariifolium]